MRRLILHIVIVVLVLAAMVVTGLACCWGACGSKEVGYGQSGTWKEQEAVL